MPGGMAGILAELEGGALRADDIPAYQTPLHFTYANDGQNGAGGVQVAFSGGVWNGTPQSLQAGTDTPEPATTSSTANPAGDSPLTSAVLTSKQPEPAAEPAIEEDVKPEASLISAFKPLAGAHVTEGNKLEWFIEAKAAAKSGTAGGFAAGEGGNDNRTKRKAEQEAESRTQMAQYLVFLRSRLDTLNADIGELTEQIDAFEAQYFSREQQDYFNSLPPEDQFAAKNEAMLQMLAEGKITQEQYDIP